MYESDVIEKKYENSDSRANYWGWSKVISRLMIQQRMKTNIIRNDQKWLLTDILLNEWKLLMILLLLLFCEENKWNMKVMMWSRWKQMMIAIKWSVMII